MRINVILLTVLTIFLENNTKFIKRHNAVRRLQRRNNYFIIFVETICANTKSTYVGSTGDFWPFCWVLVSEFLLQVDDKPDSSTSAFMSELPTGSSRSYNNEMHNSIYIRREKQLFPALLSMADISVIIIIYRFSDNNMHLNALEMSFNELSCINIATAIIFIDAIGINI